MPRYMEINADGVAFHQPDPLTQFVSDPPPTEVLFCDCEGIGVICHHTYASGREFTVIGNTVTPESKAEFLAAHQDCGPVRRQIFVDVTTRADVRLDLTGKTILRYDEATDAFTVVPITPSNKVNKVAFLTALGPELVAAWFASPDPVLVLGREAFKADTMVDIDSALVGAVLTQGVKLGLITQDQAAQTQQTIVALAPVAASAQPVGVKS